MARFGRIRRWFLWSAILWVFAPCALHAGSPSSEGVSTTATTTRPTITIRAAHFPPLYYRDPQGEWTGLDVELARLLVTTAGYQPRFVEMPWSRALLAMQQGSLQMMTNLAQSAERDHYIRWLGPERVSTMGIVVKQRNLALTIESLDDLIRLAHQHRSLFGAQQDVYYSEAFNRRLADPEFAAAFSFVTHSELAHRMLQADRILGFVEDVDVMRYQIQSDPEFKGLALHSFRMSGVPVYFGVSRQGVSEAMFQQLQSAFMHLEATGAFARIRGQEWHPTRP